MRWYRRPIPQGGSLPRLHRLASSPWLGLAVCLLALWAEAIPIAASQAPAPVAQTAKKPDGRTTPRTREQNTDGTRSASKPPPFDPLCPRGDLVRRSRVTPHLVEGGIRALSDGVLVGEGEGYNKAQAALFRAFNGGRIDVDMYRERDLRYLVIQADAGDSYRLQGSADGKSYSTIWQTEATDGIFGQRTRFVELPQKRRVRYLRLDAQGGDGTFIVSELRAYCQAPSPWPPALTQKPPETWWHRIDSPLMLSLKGFMAFGAALVMLLGFVWPWPLRPLPQRRWLERGLLAGAALGIGWTGHTGLLLGLHIGAALLVIWFLLRWMSPHEFRLRGWISSVAAAATGPNGILVFVSVAILSTAAVARFQGVLLAAATATGWLAVYLWLRAMRQPVCLETTVYACLSAFGLLGLVSFWNLGHFHYDHYVHIWEHYHYFMGAKYAPELRYSRLYECTAVADAADGRRQQVQQRAMRQLGTDNALGTTEEILKNPRRCTDHFRPDRWAAFRKDIRFFRARFSQERWDRSQTDHGYNATPFWTFTARLIADAMGDLTWEKIEHMAAIDSILLLAMWLAVLWGFGWVPASVALVYWGFNYPARFYWNGGAFLRYDWQFFMVLGVCLLRRKKHFWSGTALTIATGLRIFPGFVVAALVLKALGTMFKERRLVLSREHTRFAAGCLTMIALVIPASDWAAGGLDAWPEFIHNSRKHLNTALTNNMGLKTVLGYDYATRASQMRNNSLHDPFEDWKRARKHYYEARAPIFYTLVLMFVVMLARACSREEDWAAACLGAGLMAIVMELTCYYYGFLLLYGLMWPRRKLPGILAALLAGVTYPLSRMPWNDDRFMAMSLATVLVVIIVTAHAAFGRRLVETPDTQAAG